ncbi:MAG: alpha-galactosidase, partial [Planctomycetota bacterium]
LKMTRAVELAGQGSMFRMYVRLSNNGRSPKAVEWFPGWRASWKLTDTPTRARWWKALSYQRNTIELSPGKKIDLGSRLHSSDVIEGGVNPYWIVGGKNTQLHFAIAWCGGWKATLQSNGNLLDWKVWLPPEETQLVLKPGETIAGPVIYITVTKESDEARARSSWMLQRARLARELYGGPPVWYPFHYNHWYSVRFAVDAAFLRRQVENMDPYGFDSFVIDDGWFEKAGLWNATTRRFAWNTNPKKFKPGEFADILRAARKKGAVPGIWTAPQLVNSPNKNAPPYLDDPVYYNGHSGGYGLDLTALDFKSHLLEHVKAFRENFDCGWWKYDQHWFRQKTRAGIMKNVDAFQNALLAVRAANPDLHIEGCNGGGRMINELTLLATQSHWLLDGGHTGLNHARQNIVVALGAMDFIFPWAATRWTNNPDRNDQNDDEFTRFYCRSAMAGIWGIVADLPLIGEQQRNVIIAETKNYRRLNKLKNDCLYDLYLPGSEGGIASITFYHASGKAAGILIYRWDRTGAFEHIIPLKQLITSMQYQVQNVDNNQIIRKTGRELHHKGLVIPFGPQQLSALVFIKAVDEN